MRSRILTALAAALLVAGWGTVAAGQDGAGGWTPARTADGQPDIQGIWTNYDGTPFEAPSQADIERLAPLAALVSRHERPGPLAQRRRPAQGHSTSATGSGSRTARTPRSATRVGVRWWSTRRTAACRCAPRPRRRATTTWST